MTDLMENYGEATGRVCGTCGHADARHVGIGRACAERLGRGGPSGTRVIRCFCQEFVALEDVP